MCTHICTAGNRLAQMKDFVKLSVKTTKLQENFLSDWQARFTGMRVLVIFIS